MYSLGNWHKKQEQHSKVSYNKASSFDYNKASPFTNKCSKRSFLFSPKCLFLVTSLFPSCFVLLVMCFMMVGTWKTRYISSIPTQCKSKFWSRQSHECAYVNCWSPANLKFTLNLLWYRWMKSNRPLSCLDGFFLRVRLAKWEKGVAGSGYYVASVNGIFGNCQILSSNLCLCQMTLFGYTSLHIFWLI